MAVSATRGKAEREQAEREDAERREIARRDQRRGRVPWALVVAVFLPVAVAYGVWLRTLESLRFAHPYALLLIPLGLGLVLFAAVRRGQQRRPVLTFSRASELLASKRGIVARLADLPTVLRLLLVVLLGLTLARPQTSRPSNDLDVEGIDIVIALDLSGSMAEIDLAPNRLAAAKLVIRDFVRRRPTDRIGLVVFGRDAYTYVPLTLDHGAYLRMLGELQLELIDGKGTAIGNGLGTALARLRRSDARSKVIILLTDGDNNAGNITPEQAADIARQLGIKIYTVLAGDNQRGGDDEPGVPGMARRRFPVNPKLLEEIATKTGGMPYLATDTRALAQRFQDILADLEKSRIRDRGVLYAELFPRFLLPAVAILLLETLLRMTRLRRLP
jgi:Ca-activated chloride channel family protein